MPESRSHAGIGRTDCLFRAVALSSVLAGLFFIQTCSGAVTITEAEAKRSAIEKPAPTISPLARQMKVSGRIELEVTIGIGGAVQAVKPLAGNPLLVESSVAAVRKWKFTPFVEGGSATTAITTLTFEFKQ
jgi:outer membrane biosynthesis protein TonB